MPLYPVKNLKTGEQKDIHMSVADYVNWRMDNPDWDKDWSQGCAGLRSKDKEYYSSDHIASGSAYTDKNDSLGGDESNVMDYDHGSDVNNDLVKQKYGWN
tara:strand:- start:371 stop:670 length:300 start_codon:yes stop_codon:yes gene_type:complete